LVPSARHLLALGGLDPVLAAPLTDAALTPYSAVKKALPRLVPGTSAVLIGAGGQAADQIRAVQAVRPLRSLTVIDSDLRKAKQLLKGMSDELGVIDDD
jgi:propanol-preferring alcohol dehydrogenase